MTQIRLYAKDGNYNHLEIHWKLIFKPFPIVWICILPAWQMSLFVLYKIPLFGSLSSKLSVTWTDINFVSPNLNWIIIIILLFYYYCLYYYYCFYVIWQFVIQTVCDLDRHKFCVFKSKLDYSIIWSFVYFIIITIIIFIIVFMLFGSLSSKLSVTWTDINFVSRANPEIAKYCLDYCPG